jgi:chromosome segregation ATPase
LKRIVEVEARFVEAAKTRQLAEAQAKLQIEKEERLNTEVENLRQAEQQHRKRVEEMNLRIPQLEESRRVAEQEAHLRQEQEQQLRLTLSVLREQEQDHNKRIEELQKSLSAQVQACYTLEAEVREKAEKEQEAATRIGELRQAKENRVKLVEDVEVSLRSLEQTRHYNETETRRRTEREEKLHSEIEALRHAEAEQLKRIEEAEARLREQEQARQAARAKATQLAEQEEQLEEELKSFQAEERSQLDRLQQLQARVLEEEQAIQAATAEARREADNAEERLAELESVRSSLQSKTPGDKAQQLAAEMESMRSAEAEQLVQVEAAECRLRAHEEALQSAQARINQLAEEERALANDLESLRAAEEAQLRRLDEMKSRQRNFVQLAADREPIDSKAIVPVSEAAEWNLPEPAQKSPAETPWLQIDLQHSESGNGDHHEAGIVTSSVQSDYSSFSNVADDEHELPSLASVLESTPDSGIPAALLDKLNGGASTQRAAALADLAEIGGEEAFELITNAFDDSVVEVRNAAARALYDLNADRTGSFTRALREASPERRRKIGAAIAGSGLAANALNALSGESRDRTYDAYSLLFLMAKVGEVVPLLQAVSRHSNIDVRLTAIKLIALSNQQQVLSSLRNMAAREALPPEVQAAVMEAIYSISAQAREHAPSLA